MGFTDYLDVSRTQFMSADSTNLKLNASTGAIA